MANWIYGASQHMRRRDALAALIGAGAVAAGLAPALAQTTDGAQADNAQKADETPNPIPLADRGYALGEQVMGDADAPVTMIEYASLTCPHCAHFHNETLPQFKTDYIDTGKVRLIFREVYFDKYGLWAGMIARCGGASGYFPMLSVFMKRQSDWTRSDDIIGEMKKIGRLAGMSNARMDACLTDREFAKSLVADYQDAAKRDGVNATPTFLINGEQIKGAQEIDAFAKVIDPMLN